MLKQKWQRDMSLHSTCTWDVMTKEEFKRDVDVLPSYQAVIVDEAHHFFGHKSQMHKSLLKYFKKHETEYRLLLTATPYLSTPFNIYAAMLLLDHPVSYPAFINIFFHKLKMGRKIVLKVRKDRQKELADLVKMIGDVVGMEEVLSYDNIDMPDQNINVMYLEMGKDQQKEVDEAFDIQFITEWTRKHQIENGYVPVSAENEAVRVLDGVKDIFIEEKVKGLVSEGNKVAIFCRYKKQIEILKEKLSKYAEVVEMTGDTKDQQGAVDRIETGGPCIALIQSSCSAGYELPSVNHVIFASLSFSYVDYVQALGRFMRMNKPTRNFYTHVVVKGGVDEDVYNCIMLKQDFSMAIYKK